MQEIDKISPKAEEIEELESEINRLRNQELLTRTSREAALALYEGDGSIFEQIGALTHKLDEAARHDPSLAASAADLENVAAVIEDTARFLVGYGRGEESNPERLSALDDRLEALRALVRKHGTDLSGVITLRESISGEIAVLQQYEESLVQLERDLDERVVEAGRHAKELSQARRSAGRKLSKAVTSELKDLKFSKARFEVRVEDRPEGLAHSGADRVAFQVTLNPGEGTHPLRRVASGGELSRLMLAVKRAMAGVGPVGTYFFDEVDAGVSGHVAAAVGRKLKEVAAHHQVICITHLPQIAGMADVHLLVSKGEERGRTTSVVRPLDQKQRIEEISRMLGGEQVTDKTRAAARELIF